MHCIRLTTVNIIWHTLARGFYFSYTKPYDIVVVVVCSCYLHYLWNVTVFLDTACLHAYLHDNGPFGIEDLHHFGYQLFNALEYLHSTLRIIHCDVKRKALL